jgi:site-specific DNA-methyltransferase (adenine-specific)
VQHRSNGNTYGMHKPNSGFDTTQGRWPANVIHDGSEEVTAAFPDAKAAYVNENSAASKLAERKPTVPRGITSFDDEKPCSTLYTDSGSAARFYYTAKADSDDRLGSRHPTIKPLSLMQYLVRLICPKGGVVLDCFAGTGTTAEAAWREGMSAVLIEREAEYCADIRRRMALALAGPDERARESIKARNLPRDDGPLFSGIPEAEAS